MTDKNASFLSKQVSPYIQGAFILGLMLLFNLLAFILGKAGLNVGDTVAWEISLTLMLFFALANVMFFLNADNKTQYWSQSITTYAALAMLSVYIAKWISGIGLSDSGSIRWIYIVFAFGYLIFVSIAGLMRKIVEIAIKQDKRLRGEE